MSFIVQGVHPFISCVSSSRYTVGACRPGVMSVPVFLVLGRCLLSRFEVGVCHHGMRSVPVDPVQRWCLLSRQRGQCLSYLDEVGAFVLVFVPV